MIVKWYQKPDCMKIIFSYCVGDFKARQPLIGSEGNTTGKNGKVYYYCLQNTSRFRHITKYFPSQQLLLTQHIS